MTSQLPNEKVIDLIRKCLALSHSPNENEAALALSKAQELLEKYNLSMSEVSVEDHKIPDIVQGDISYEGEDWIRRLYVAVAEHNFCKVVSHQSKGISSIIGRFVNMEATVEMALWIKDQMERISRTELSKVSKYEIDEFGRFTGRVTNKRAYKASFMLGMVSRLRARLEEMSEQRKVEVPSLRALTINLLKEAELQRHIFYPYLVNIRTSVTNTDAFHRGQEAANNVGLVRPSHHISDNGTLRLGGER